MKARTSAIALTALLGLAGCGGASESHPPTTAPSSAAASVGSQAAADITSAWMTFFHTGTKPAAAKRLLQNGDRMTQAIKVAAQVQRQTKLKEDARVTKVAITSPTTATVTYDLLSHGTTLLPGATGQAVLQDGRWKVSTETFCTLVELGAGGKKIPGC